MKQKIRIGIWGYSGRMGQEVAEVIKASSNTTLFYSPGRKEKWDLKKAQDVDVWIDFSTPEALVELLKKAPLKPIVSGTTGIEKSEKSLIVKHSKKAPILWASNMSMGVAVLNEALSVFSAVSQFDFQIEEFHHNKKKDNPSGTALTLQETLAKAISKELPPAIGIRGGGIFGVHKVHAMSDEETLCFEHTALNRTVFAKGAVRAAVWLAQKKPGQYQIRDVLFGAKK